MEEVGVSLLIAGELPLEEALRKVAEVGFTQVELGCQDGPIGAWRNDPAGMRRMLEAAGLRGCTVHTHSAGWDNDAADEAARRVSVDAASAVFAAAGEAGADIVICHPNTSSHPYLDVEYELNTARSVDSLGRLAERAGAAGVRMAVENMPFYGEPRPGGTMTEIMQMIDGLGPHVGVCLDAGHANANGRNGAEEVRACGGGILCVHIQDNDGKGGDQHLVPGRGTVDWEAFLAALDRAAPDCVRNFEVGPRTDDLDATLAELTRLRRRWEGA